MLHDRYELMANFAAYTGLRWGELAALTVGQVDVAGRVVRVDRKVVEIGGQLFVEAPKNRKRRRTIYPRLTPEGYPLADRIASRAGEVADEQAAGRNPLGLMFPSPGGGYWRSSNFCRRVSSRVPGDRLAGCRGRRPVDVAQPAARVLHHGAEHLADGRAERVPPGRARQRSRHARDDVGSTAGISPRPRRHRVSAVDPMRREEADCDDVRGLASPDVLGQVVS